MGKYSWIRRVDEEDEDGENYNPAGCMWKRFIYALDYHHWHYNVRKKLLHGLLHDGKRHDKNKTKLISNDPGEAQRFLVDKESLLQVDQSPKKHGLNNKRSLRARIKALIVEQSQEGNNHKQQGAGNYKQSKFQRTYSIHHLEPTDDDPDWKQPIFILPGNPNKDSKILQDKEEITVKEKSCTPKEQLNEDKDVLELFKVNKELFLKILQDAEVGSGKISHNLMASNSKIRLTKSGSFPIYDSKRGNCKPLKLKDKQNEVWSCAKGEKLGGDCRAPKLARPKYAKDLLESLGLLVDEEDNMMLSQASTLDFRCKATEVENEEDTEMNMPVKEGKQVAEIEGNKEKNGSKFATILAPLDELRSGQGDMDMGSDSSTTQETDGCGIHKSSFLHRRSSSLNESLDRYSRLYDHSFGKEVKLKPGKSLKVTNEHVIPSIPFRRIRSLSNVDSSYFLQIELLGSAPFSDHPIRTAEESSSMNVTSEGEEKPESKEKAASVDAKQEIGCHSEQAGNSDGCLSANTDDEDSPDMEGLAREVDELKLVRGNSYREQEIKCSEVASNDIIHSHLDSNFETCFEEEISTLADFQISKGSDNTCNLAEEKDFAINSRDSFYTDSVSSQKFTNIEKAYQHRQSNIKNDPDLWYVMDILECSGFTLNFFQGTWYSSDQPLNPSVFEEVEACWHQEFRCSREEVCGCYHHQMLFDLVNEVLVQIYDRSFTYYPKALSSGCHICSLPPGNRIIEEVCSSISSLLNLKPEVKESLDCIVGGDLEKGYGWMNLQPESEYVALELEGMLFDDLLDELLNP